LIDANDYKSRNPNLITLRLKSSKRKRKQLEKIHHKRVQ